MGKESENTAETELLGTIMVLRKRHLAALRLVETHSCELLRLLAEAKRLDDLTKEVLEAYQALKCANVTSCEPESTEDDVIF